VRGSRNGVGRALIAAQVAVSLLLLSGAGLLTRSLWNLRHQDFGFRPDGLLVADMPWEFNPAMMARYAAMREPLLERLRAIPGARSAALSGFGPMGDAQYTNRVGGVMVRMVLVSTRYFETTEIPIVAGRGLSEDDRAGAKPVVVLSQTAARALFGGENPLGQRVSGKLEVVGVSRDVKFANAMEEFRPLIFLPIAQSPAPITAALVRVSGDPARAVANVRAAFHAVDPEITLGKVQPLTAIIDGQLGKERVLALLAGCFGLLALVLTSIGVYGVISYAVERRSREIGIRIALGARRAAISGMLVGDVAAVATVGVVLGGAGSVAVSRALRGMLFGIAPDDYSTAAISAALLAGIAALAAYLPARRAARLDPMTTLRRE
jgi:predicted permease